MNSAAILNIFYFFLAQNLNEKIKILSFILYANELAYLNKSQFRTKEIYIFANSFSKQ
jgi:hypothetical protein